MSRPDLPILPLRQDVLLSNALFEEIEDGLTEDFLREYSGNYDLSEVSSLEIQVDAIAQRVECLGELLPNLNQMRLSGSHLCTVRDLGTGLQNLKVLWLCRCFVQDLGGITALPVLEELYVSFNDIKDLSPLLAHETLQILDLEGNLVDDLDEVTSLEAVATLRELDLSSNPVLKLPGVTRECILEALPQIEVLDSLPRYEATTATSCVEISDCEEAAMELSSEEDKEREARNEDISSVSQLLKEVQTPSHQHFFIGEEVEDNAQQFYIGEEGMPVARRGLVEDESGDRALQQLRQRAGGVSKVSVDKTQVQPIVAEDGLSAVDTFRESAAKATASPRDDGEEKMPRGPTEQDLVIESVKRERSGGSWTSRTSRSSRQASSRRPHTGFFPAKRQVWGSSSGGSTCASSLTSSRSFVSALLPGKPDGFASDLTVGEDGMALAGNPLAAIRRRRRTNHERGEDEMDIRDLLRRFEAGVGQEEAPQVAVESQSRPATSDVRIRCRPQSASSPTSAQKSRNDSVISTGPKLKALGPEVLVIQ